MTNARRNDKGLPRLVALALVALLAAACAREPEPVDFSDVPESELLDRITRAGDGGAVHLIRVVHRGELYSFDPPEVEVSSGDVVRFVMSGSRPESVVFDAGGATPEVGEFIVERSMHLGVLLVEPGQSHDISLRDAPPGEYPFLSIPHAERGMRGVVRVVE